MVKVVPVESLNKCVVCFDYTMQKTSCSQCYVCILCNSCREKVARCPCCRKEFKKKDYRHLQFLSLMFILSFMSGACVRYLIDYPYKNAWDIILNVFLGLPIILLGCCLGIMLGFVQDYCIYRENF